MPPQRPNFVLSSYIPHVELDVLVGYCLDVEANSWYGGDVLVQLELVKNSCEDYRQLTGPRHIVDAIKCLT